MKYPAILAAAIAAAAAAAATAAGPAVDDGNQSATANGREEVSSAPAAPLSAIGLPAPDTVSGAPLMKAMKDRQSLREYSGADLSPQQLSDVLWAAAGTNRPDGRRTAGSTRNFKAVSVYAVLRNGIFLYDAAKNLLEPVAEGDFRELAGKQPFVKTAPLNLLFVGDFDAMKVPDKDRQMLFFGCDIGLMSQNVYLYCASAGLATVVRGLVENDPLAKAMGLPDGKRVLMAQTVGIPKPKPLVAFFSWGGNTRAAANAVAKAIGADIVEIKPASPYPGDYQECVARAADEIRDGLRPELVGGSMDLSPYEKIVVGSPNWWGTVPPPVASFLSTNDFSGKELSLFVTHGTGGLQKCAVDAALAARAKIAHTNCWVGGDVAEKLDEIAAWAKEAAAE